MKCPICLSEMIVDTWEGWVWYCPTCKRIHRNATDKEIEKMEAEQNEHK